MGSVGTPDLVKCFTLGVDKLKARVQSQLVQAPPLVWLVSMLVGCLRPADKPEELINNKTSQPWREMEFITLTLMDPREAKGAGDHFPLLSGG